VRRLPVPKQPPATHFRAYKITKRIDEDISAVLAVFYLKVDGGRIRDAKVAFGGMAGIPKRAKTVGDNFVAGRYRRPRVEERVLLFVDMESSTVIAEHLGEASFLDFLNR
jgi:xanthine dehydrogenase small subunit